MPIHFLATQWVFNLRTCFIWKSMCSSWSFIEVSYNAVATTHRAQKTIVIKSSNTNELPPKLGECRPSDRHLRGFSRYTVRFRSQNLFLIWKSTCLSSSFNSSITQSCGDGGSSTEIYSSWVDQRSQTTTPIGWAPCLRQTALRTCSVHGEFPIPGGVSYM